MKEKDYIAVVQCHLVKQRCSGYFCEKSFNERTGGFSGYAPDRSYRTLHLTCGGCCGRPLHRKLSNLMHKIKEKEGKEAISGAFFSRHVMRPPILIYEDQNTTESPLVKKALLAVATVDCFL